MPIAGSRCHPRTLPPSSQVRRPAGFTVVEMAVTLAVAVILLGIGVPAFSTLIDNQRMTTAAGDFLAAIHLARSEAVQRGTRVDLVPVDGRDWKNGWVVFVDGNGNLRPDPGEPLIFSHGPVADRLVIDSNFTDDSVRYIAYAATGRTRTNRNGQQPQSGTITFSLGKQARKIKINFLGRARVCNPADDPSDC